MKTIFSLLACIALLGCVKDRNFDFPERSCDSELIANTTYSAVKNLYIDETIQIQEDLVIEGYVISSDRAGNFFSVLHFQDKPVAPSEGFQIEIDIRDSHLFYPVGSKILIKLKGLYLGQSKGVFKIGGVFTSFGNVSVGRLPATAIDNHIFVSCDAVVTVEPTQIFIDGIEAHHTNTLVRFDRLEMAIDEVGLPFAVEQKETERTLIDCSDNEIVLLNSGFSDFHSTLLPNGSGSITGLLKRQNRDYQLVIRNLDDIDFFEERCEDVVDEFTSTHIFISELADPNNNTAARFVELYNSASEDLNLKGWSLRRYTNANIEVSSSVDLTGLTIKAQRTLVISPNAEEFQAVYGFAPDLGVGTNTPADTNGDDNLELVDPFGTIIDVFGIIGEDGTGTNHEFEDGKAVRNLDIISANPTYTFAEWTIYNDSGNASTIDQPQNAPDDFNPWKRQ